VTQQAMPYTQKPANKKLLNNKNVEETKVEFLWRLLVQIFLQAEQ